MGRRAVTAITVLAVWVLVLAPPTAQAAGDSASAVCSLSFVERFSPGLTLAPVSGSQDSAVETGHVSCEGTVGGRRLTGGGTFWNTGRNFDESCLKGHATGSYFLTVDTEAGPVALDGTFVVDRVGTLLRVSTRAAGVTGEGTALVIPIKGDCALNPVTDTLVLMSIRFEEETTAVRSCDLDLGVLLINCSTRSQGSST